MSKSVMEQCAIQVYIAIVWTPMSVLAFPSRVTNSIGSFLLCLTWLSIFNTHHVLFHRRQGLVAGVDSLDCRCGPLINKI